MTDQNIKTALGEDGVLLARIDMPGRSMNVFSLEMMDSLERLLDRVESDERIVAVVLASGKDSFLVGADLSMIRMFTERARTDTHDQLVDLCGRLGRLFRRLERSAKPFVAAVDGLALGGGLELCLASHARVLSDRKRVALGLPEIKLGLLPGAGGTQRLPRLIGVRRGLDMLLRGEPVRADAALACGLADEIVPADQLIDRARAKALSMDGGKPRHLTGAFYDTDDEEIRPGDAGAHERIARALVLDDALLERYPAYRAIMDCVIQGWAMPIDLALDNEMDVFVRLIQDPVAGNMVRALFLDRQRSLKSLDIPLEVPPEAGGVPVGTCGPDEAGLAAGCAAGVWAAPRGPYGQAVEILWDGDPQARVAALIAARSLRPDAVLVTPGRDLVLAALARAAQAAQARGLPPEYGVALRAQEAAEAGRVTDEALLDSAAVVAGIMPAWTGGPFAFLQRVGRAECERRAEAAGLSAGDRPRAAADCP